MLLSKDSLRFVSTPHDDSQAHGSVEGRIEDGFGVDFFVESVNGHGSGWMLETFEAGDGAARKLVGGPQVLPVGVSVSIASLGMDGVPTFALEQSDVFGRAAFLLYDELQGIVGSWDHVAFLGVDGTDDQPLRAGSLAHGVCHRYGSRVSLSKSGVARRASSGLTGVAHTCPVDRLRPDRLLVGRDEPEAPSATDTFFERRRRGGLDGER